ncbi:MAG: hypothetical protein EAX81_05520 [Candidatus Thorarchaeota archaeon]|nr:hypothetical protein [Candidatus Thorarchaeota archaeon]
MLGEDPLLRRSSRYERSICRIGLEEELLHPPQLEDNKRRRRGKLHDLRRSSYCELSESSFFFICKQSYLDRILLAGQLQLKKQAYFERISFRNRKQDCGGDTTRNSEE